MTSLRTSPGGEARPTISPCACPTAKGKTLNLMRQRKIVSIVLNYREFGRLPRIEVNLFDIDEETWEAEGIKLAKMSCLFPK
jgi:hypothetical protein